MILGVSLLHAASLAPITVLADALALGSAYPPASSGRRGFEYGWVRGTGSAAFIIGTLLSGQAVSAFGLDVIVQFQASLLAGAALAGTLVPELFHTRAADAARAPARGVLILLRLPLFRNLVLVAALVLGSHAMHDAFAVIRWSAAGIGPATASLLWSESVAAEVVVFFVIGPALVTRLTPAGALATSLHRRSALFRLAFERLESERQRRRFDPAGHVGAAPVRHDVEDLRRRQADGGALPVRAPIVRAPDAAPGPAAAKRTGRLTGLDPAFPDGVSLLLSPLLWGEGPGMARRWQVVLGMTAAALVAATPLVYSSHRTSYSRNFRVVEEGVLYRSGQLTPAGLDRVIRERGIKTVVSFSL